MNTMFERDLANNEPHDYADKVYKLLNENLSRFFDHVYSRVQSPRAMLLVVESILPNPAFFGEKQLHVALGRRGLSALDSYCTEAQYFFERGCDGMEKVPLWHLEGDVIRRWSPNRRGRYMVCEAFWMVFLNRYVGGADNRIEQILFEGFTQAHAESNAAMGTIPPNATFESFSECALRNIWPDAARWDYQEQMGFMVRHVYNSLR